MRDARARGALVGSIAARILTIMLSYLSTKSDLESDSLCSTFRVTRNDYAREMTHENLESYGIYATSVGRERDK